MSHVVSTALIAQPKHHPTSGPISPLRHLTLYRKKHILKTRFSAIMATPSPETHAFGCELPSELPMRVRLAVSPVVFAASLVVLSIAFYNRKKFYSDVWEKQRLDAIESRVQAAEFKEKLREAQLKGVKTERVKRSIQ